MCLVLFLYGKNPRNCIRRLYKLISLSPFYLFRLDSYDGQFESVDIGDTQFSVNQHREDNMQSQMGSNVDWEFLNPEPAELVIQMEEDGQDEGIVDDETDSDHYDDFLVRCEGDTDVEDCFPTQIAS